MLLSLLFPYVFAATSTFPLATSSVAVANEQAIEFASSTLAGTPLMAVAECESGQKQWNEDTGVVLQGKVDPRDRGFLQINRRWHLAAATAMGYDLDTASGNILYARWLYDQQGLKPWVDSESCWKDMI